MTEAADVGDPPPAADEQAQRLAETLGREVRLEARGGESRTFRLAGTDHLVTVAPSWPLHTEPAAELIRRTTLQERIADRVTVPVPRPVRVVPEAGLVVVRRLEGVRLIDAPGSRNPAVQRLVASTVGTLLAQLHTWDPEAYEDLAVVDEYTPADWRDEAAELAQELDQVLDGGQRGEVQRFLAQPPPPPAATPVLSHNDLGIEHVLISSTGAAVTGVIDWDDAAACDPAYDFGLLLRDLGPEALDIALAAYAAAGAVPHEHAERAEFYARCTLLEDLAFGHAEDRREYVEKSLAAWPLLFGPGSTD